jgi:hypothetical protein
MLPESAVIECLALPVKLLRIVIYFLALITSVNLGLSYLSYRHLSENLYFFAG